MNPTHAVITSFDPVTYKATVQLADPQPRRLHDLPVARNIAPADMLAGRRCAILFFSESDPTDAVVVAVYT